MLPLPNDLLVAYPALFLLRCATIGIDLYATVSVHPPIYRFVHQSVHPSMVEKRTEFWTASRHYTCISSRVYVRPRLSLFSSRADVYMNILTFHLRSRRDR